MRVLHVISSLTVGGAQRLVSSLLPELIKLVQVDLLVYKKVNSAFEQDLVKAGVNIISLDINNVRNPLSVLKMRKVFKDYDIIHAHLFPTIYWVALASMGLNVRLIYTEHSTFNRRRVKPYLRPLERFIYSKYSKIISISTQVHNNLIKWLQANDNRFVIIRNGVKISMFENNIATTKPKRIVMVSRFVPAKDQQTLIRALSYLQDDIRLRFVGSGETLSECMSLARKLNLDGRIEFLGEQTNVPKLIAESYIGVQSSHWEGFGLAAVEVMAAGKPLVASNVEGLNEVVDGAGVLFEPGDERALAEALNKLLSNEEHYNKVAKSCKERAKMYDVSAMAKGYWHAYKYLL